MNWTAAPAALQAAGRSAEALAAQGRLAEALAVYLRLRAVAPDEPWIALGLGAVLLRGPDSEAAQRHFQALTQRWPGLEGAWQGLGKALFDLRDCPQAVAAFTEAAAVAAAPARALYHRGMAHLLAGNLGQGWRDYEHRLAVAELRPRLFDRPRWDGSALAGRRLLVVCEQGYGDVFQFIRFVPRLLHRGGAVVFECPDELRALLAPVLDGCMITPLVGRAAPDVAFDCYAPLLSLPHLLGITLDDVAGTAPYLRAAPLAGGPSGVRQVGLCWAGSATHPQDLHRSMDPELLAPLAGVPGIQLVSLQHDPAARPPLPELGGFIAAPPVRLGDFATTARVIAGLDLVVTVDTAVAHLAGALDRPVWLLLPYAGEWRWLLGRSDSPWYPSMRIFRQPKLGDWAAVVAQVVGALGADPARGIVAV